MTRDEAFQTLSLNESSTEDEIKKAFRKQAAENHPDKHEDKIAAEAKFKKINQAYQILTGKEKSEDQMMNNNFAYDYETNMQEILNNFMGGGRSPFNIHFQQQHQNNSIHMDDVYVNLNLTFEESVLGCEKKHIAYKIQVFCETCAASGLDPNTKGNCQTCKGTGFLRKQIGGAAFIRIEQVVCLACQGKGSTGEKCKACNGEKFSTEEVSINLKVPAVGERQAKLLVKSKGNKFKTLTTDAYVIITPTLEGGGIYKNYYIEGNKVRSSINVTLDKLLFGGKAMIKTVCGEEKEIDIPAQTKVNDEIIIKNYGVKTATVGNHIITVEAKYPEKEKLTNELKDLLEAAYK